MNERFFSSCAFITYMQAIHDSLLSSWFFHFYAHSYFKSARRYVSGKIRRRMNKKLSQSKNPSFKVEKLPFNSFPHLSNNSKLLINFSRERKKFTIYIQSRLKIISYSYAPFRTSQVFSYSIRFTFLLSVFFCLSPCKKKWKMRQVRISESVEWFIFQRGGKKRKYLLGHINILLLFPLLHARTLNVSSMFQCFVIEFSSKFHCPVFRCSHNVSCSRFMRFYVDKVVFFVLQEYL